jgi:hypothetical protein
MVGAPAGSDPLNARPGVAAILLGVPCRW